jgi:hypothetical protein
MPSVKTTHHPLHVENPDQCFLTVMEAAALLRVSQVTLARWRIAGVGPPDHKFSRRIVYSMSDLISWADAQRRQSTSECHVPDNRSWK